MKNNLYINQVQAIRLGITNINQAHILDLITTCSSWAQPVTTDQGVFYWVARQMICQELPLLGIKPDTAYRHLKSLHESGFIEYIKRGKKDLVRLSEKGRKYYIGNKSEFNQNSEINPTKLGNKSEKNSEINPTDPTTRSNPTTIDHNSDEKFNAWWTIYEKPTGKKPAYKLWIKLDEETKDLIIERTPDFVKHHNNPKYRPNPLTFLNQERWLDDEPLQAANLKDLDDRAVMAWEKFFKRCVQNSDSYLAIFEDKDRIKQTLINIDQPNTLDIKMMSEKKVIGWIKPQFINEYRKLLSKQEV